MIRQINMQNRTCTAAWFSLYTFPGTSSPHSDRFSSPQDDKIVCIQKSINYQPYKVSINIYPQFSLFIDVISEIFLEMGNFLTI